MTSSPNSVTSWYSKALADLKKLPGKGNVSEKAWVQKYLGSNKPTRCVKTADIVKLAGQITKQIDAEMIIPIVDLLYSQATTFEEIHLAGAILKRNITKKTEVAPKKLDYWLNFTHGWAEIDVLCQSGWDTDVILANWGQWQKLLTKFAKNKSIQKRRAALVLLVTPVRASNDTQLSFWAFKNIEALKHEKEVLITKAISWLLRSLIKNHKKEVAKYIKDNKDSLPKIAIRETTKKLTTGKK